MHIPLSIDVVRGVENRYRPGMMKWHYEHGLVLYASYISALLHRDSTVYPWIYSMYSPMIAEDGNIMTYRKGEYNLDQINAGRMLFNLYRESGEKRFLKAADILYSQLETQPRCRSGVYWHKEIYPWQIWLDGLYMEGPFKAEYASLRGADDSFDDIVSQLLIVRELMRDEKTGLYYHCYDESRGMKWSDDRTGLSPHFWSRAIGWYFMALIDVLDYLPQSHAGRESIIGVISELASAIIRFQDDGGMWYQVTDEGGREGNYHETSSTSMFAYSLLKGIRMDYLPSAYKVNALKAIQGICNEYLREDESGLHLGGICSVAGLGGNPYRDGSFRYYISEKVVEDDFKGVGPFIIACSELEKS